MTRTAADGSISLIFVGLHIANYTTVPVYGCANMQILFNENVILTITALDL